MTDSAERTRAVDQAGMAPLRRIPSSEPARQLTLVVRPAEEAGVLKRQAITAARELLASERRRAWPAPLVRWLRERSPGLALDWVFRCARALLPRSGTPHTEALLADLAQLERWRAEPPTSAAVHGKVEDIWYRRSRDGAQTAVCRLCWDLGCAVCPDLKVGPNWVWPVVCTLCGDERPDPELVEWCIADFERFTADLPEGPAEPVIAPDGAAPFGFGDYNGSEGPPRR